MTSSPSSMALFTHSLLNSPGSATISHRCWIQFPFMCFATLPFLPHLRLLLPISLFHWSLKNNTLKGMNQISNKDDTDALTTKHLSMKHPPNQSPRYPTCHPPNVHVCDELCPSYPETDKQSILFLTKWELPLLNHKNRQFNHLTHSDKDAPMNRSSYLGCV